MIIMIRAVKSLLCRKPAMKMIRLHRSALPLMNAGVLIQDAQGYFFLRVRDALVPVVNIASQLGWILLVFGLLSFSSSTSLFNLGLILLSVSLLFQIVTLPVEIDASRRALRILSENDLIEQTQLPMAKAMLRAAAFTYVAGVLSTMLQLLRIFLMTRRDER